MQALLTMAIRAARKTGALILRESNKIKTVNDLSIDGCITNVDIAAEEQLIETLSNAYPSHAFSGKISGELKESDYRWFLNPIDSSTHFIRKVPHWALSVACQYKNKTQVSVIYDPHKDELFTAVKGRGAQFENKKIRVSSIKRLENSLIGATGFPSLAHKQHDLRLFSQLHPHVSEMRQSGSSTLDLAYVASGRLDGVFGANINRWSAIAGALLIQESGGMVSDLNGHPDHEKSHSILAANPSLFKLMLKTIHQKNE
jgi:myo-inositol-1(or 4)-monophosphatase